MLINREVFSIPPHISTSWGHVIALHMHESHLVVSLTDGIIVKIPHLSNELIEQIFDVHAAYLSEQNSRKQRPRSLKNELEGLTTGLTAELPFRLGTSSMENMMMSSMQHNPEQAHMPDLPSEIIDKIAAIAKIVSPGDATNLPKGEPHCNCMFCQMSRAIHTHIDDAEPELEVQHSPSEPVAIAVSPTDPWVVLPSENSCYTVHHKDSPYEQYKVFIKEGEVGCNCGQQGCEHIIAVLRS